MQEKIKDALKMAIIIVIKQDMIIFLILMIYTHVQLLIMWIIIIKLKQMKKLILELIIVNK